MRIFKKTLLAMGIMFVLLMGAGFAYAYYVSKNPDESASPKEPEAVTAPKFDSPKTDPNGPNSASVQYIASPVKPGENSSITVTTGPKSACKIVVAYNKVVSKDSGLVDKQADKYGSVTWSWTVDKAAAPGKWPVKVTCERNKKVAYVEGYLEVTP